MTRLNELTLEALRRMIRQEVEQQLQERFSTSDTRSLDEILESVERHRYTPPPGSKTTLELLREDRL